MIKEESSPISFVPRVGCGLETSGFIWSAGNDLFRVQGYSAFDLALNFQFLLKLC